MTVMEINFKKKLLLVIAVAAVTLVGIRLTTSNAATPTASKEAEQGSLTSSVATINDSSASAGQAIKFGNVTSGKPVLAFYRGAPGSTDPGKAGSGIDLVSAWLGRNITMAIDFNPDATWTDIEGNNWQFGPWGTWVNAQPGRQLDFAVSPIPATGGTLAECATGAYNSHWTKLGQNLVSHQLSNTDVRFGWEMNGTWFRWSAVGKEASFIGCYQQFVTTMRAVPNSNFSYTWNPNGGGYTSTSISTMYPGDSYVDSIGVDTYDQSYAANTYPYPSPCDATCILTHQTNAWNSILSSQNAGLNSFVSFATAHNKPLVIPEWGVFTRADGHGGLDDPYYIQKMHDFINTATNRVAWYAYFDFNASDGDHRISQVPTNLVLPFPNSSTKFKALFANP